MPFYVSIRYKIHFSFFNIPFSLTCNSRVCVRDGKASDITYKGCEAMNRGCLRFRIGSLICASSALPSHPLRLLTEGESLQAALTRALERPYTHYSGRFPRLHTSMQEATEQATSKAGKMPEIWDTLL